MITLAFGIGIGAWVQASGGWAPPARFAASATDQATGVSASVVVTSEDDGARIEATVDGMLPGVQYQLFAVTVRGETRAVTRWIGTDEQTTVTGTLNSAASDLAFCTVTEVDGRVVVSVRLTDDPASPR